MKASDFFARKKVIVTGGAGFIGSHLCAELHARGADVYCLDNLSAGKVSNVAELLGSQRFHLVAKDICDRDGEMERVFSGTDIVFNNAASKKNICLHNPARDLEVNSGGTLNILELSMKHGITKFVHASTGSVYGEPSQFPSDENHPLRPVSYYGVSKLGGERYVDVFHHLYGLDATILRYFHVYGPRQESNEFGGVVSIFLRRILEGKNPVVFGSGQQVRSFTWVGDLVAANLAAAEKEVANGRVYNAASGIRVSINELAQRMLALLGRDGSLEVEYGPPLVGDIMNFDIANDKITNELGITFNTDFWGTLAIALRDESKFLGQSAS